MLERGYIIGEVLRCAFSYKMTEFVCPEMTLNQNQSIYCPSTGLQGNLSYGAQ